MEHMNEELKGPICYSDIPFQDNAGKWQSHTRRIIFVFYYIRRATGRQQTSSEPETVEEINKFPFLTRNLLRLLLGTSKDNKNYGRRFNSGSE